MGCEIRKSVKWGPGPQKNNQRGPKNNQKWSKTIPKKRKNGVSASRPPPAQRRAIFVLFGIVFDHFWLFFGPLWLFFWGPGLHFMDFLISRAIFWLFLVIFDCFLIVFSHFYGFFWPSDFIDFGPFLIKTINFKFYSLRGPWGVMELELKNKSLFFVWTYQQSRTEPNRIGSFLLFRMVSS